MVSSASYSFTFQAQELPQKLSQTSKEITGYWLFEFPDACRTQKVLYLSLSQGQVVFSGEQPLSWPGFLQALQRYVPRLRSDSARYAIATLEQRLIPEKQESRSDTLLRLLDELHQLNLLSTQEVIQAVRLKILSDLDAYLFDYSGHAQFFPCPQLQVQSPILGFDLNNLLFEAHTRQALWRKLKIQIPSMESTPALNIETVMRSNLSIEQKQRLESLVAGGKTLNEIALALAQDPLEVAKGFAQLLQNGLVTLKLPASYAPQIVIVDDSPLILKQFKNLVTRWGYQVKLSQNPTTALQTLMHANPAIIFLDINMPGMTGFDLVKQIRRQPQLATVPLIMLTAEKTLSNNWRAQWSGCKFLAKPLLPKEVPQFQMELRMLLEELAPLHQQNHFETHSMEGR